MSQAQQLLSACIEKVDVSGTEGYDLFLTQLKDGLKNTSHETAANHKVAKVRSSLTALMLEGMVVGWLRMKNLMGFNRLFQSCSLKCFAANKN